MSNEKMTQQGDFVHIHSHTSYSLLDGYGSPRDMVLTAKEIGQTALAITDHGVMFGAIEFYREAKKAGIKPIIGLEGYITNFGIPLSRKEKSVRENNHVLLIARNQEGYNNLLTLSSIGYLDGFYYKPRIDNVVLEQYSGGLIATSGCMAAEIPSLILNDAPQNQIDDLVDWYKSVFGEYFFIELQHHPGIPEMPQMNRRLIELSKRFGIPMVVTNDAHYAKESHADSHDTLLCIQTRALKAQDSRMKFSDDSFYLKTRAEMERDFLPYGIDSSAFDNTMLIADMCDANPEISKGVNHMPEIVIDGKYTSYDEALKDLAYEGLSSIYGSDWQSIPEVNDRAKEELSVIADTGFAQYYLIVLDIIKYAEAHDIIWNIRGSGTSSLICYVTGLSFIDPIDKKLVFSRFINAARVSIPDLDIDFPDDRRQEIVEYIVTKYGEDRVSQIVTFSHMKARQSIRDVGRVKGFVAEYVDTIAKAVPNIPGKPITIEDSLNKNGEYPSDALIDMYSTDDDAAEIINDAMSIEGKPRQAGVHAAAVIISDKPLLEYTALMTPPSANTVTKHITQFDYPTLESLGMLKVDCLGLSTLSIMNIACKLINERHGLNLKPQGIPYQGDSKGVQNAMKLLQSGETTAVFQVESSGLRNVLMSMQPYEFSHIMDVISLYRPGPIDYISLYIGRMSGSISIQYASPEIEPYIKDTQGIIVYQEQIIAILVGLAGYTAAEADLVRKGISKKDQNIIDVNRQKFIDGCAKNGIATSGAAGIWDDIERFALYGFNKCISGSEGLYRNTNQHGDLSIEDMYKTKNDYKWAVANGKTALHYKYKRDGYGHTLSMNEDGKLVKHKIIDIRYAGKRPVYAITLENGSTISVTGNHKFPIPGNHTVLAEDLSVGDVLYVLGKYEQEKFDARFYPDGIFEKNVPKSGEQGFQSISDGRSVAYDSIRERHVGNNDPCAICGKYSSRYELHHMDGDRANNEESNLAWLCPSCHKREHYKNHGRTKAYCKGLSTDVSKIVSITVESAVDVYDVEMAAPYHNFVTKGGIVTCNSHAASYARITMQTAWLKANFPIEFMAACLIVDGKNYDKVIKYIEECHRIGINVLPPDINKSETNFAIAEVDEYIEPSSRYKYNLTNDEGILFGFNSIKNIGEKTANELASLNGLKDVSDLLKLPRLNHKAMEYLIASGAFDSIEPNRELLLSNIDVALSEIDKNYAIIHGGQQTFVRPFLALADHDEYVADLSAMEHDALGVWIVNHPLRPYEAVIDKMPNRIEEVTGESDDVLRILCVVSSFEEKTTGAGKSMAFLKLSDLTGMCDAIMFPKTYEPLSVGEIILVAGSSKVTKAEVPTLYINSIKRNVGLPKQCEVKIISSKEEPKTLQLIYSGNDFESVNDCFDVGIDKAIIRMYRGGSPTGSIKLKNVKYNPAKGEKIGIKAIYA